MSLIDFTASLFRDQQLADAFSDNPMQTLRDAGLPDVTPADVQAMLPTVAESMPPDHPLQSWVRPAETSPVVGPEPVDPSVKHYYQLQPGDQVIDGVAGQTIMRPDGTNVTLDTNDVILQPDEKVFVMQPGDQAIPGINGMVIQHPDGSVTDVGIDTTIVHEDEAYVAGADPNSTKAEEVGEGGLDPRVTTTAEDLGGGIDPRVTTTAEDLGGSDTDWTPHEESMEWDNLEPAVLPTTPAEPGLGETDAVQPIGEDNGLGDIDPNFGRGPGDPNGTDPNASTLEWTEPVVYDAPIESQPAEAANIPYEYEIEPGSEQSDTYAADQSGNESTSATESAAGSEFIG